MISIDKNGTPETTPTLQQDHTSLRVCGLIKEKLILFRMEQPGSAHQLAFFRIFLGIQVLYSSGTRLFQLSAYVSAPAGTKNIFPGFINQLIDAIAVPYLQIIVMALSIFLALGLLTKYILPILSISFLLLFSFYYARNNAPVPWLYTWFPLLLLNFTRCSDALSLDKFLKLIRPLVDLRSKDYRWPIEVIAGWLAYIYVAAGLAKLLPIYKGWYWLQGGTSQDIMYNRYLDSMYFYWFGQPLFDYTEYRWVFAILSIASVAIELICILILFTNRYNGLIISLLMGMHLFLYLSGVMGFMQLTLLLSIALIQPGFFNKLFKEQTSPS
jgi:hypothetical protein